MTNLEQIATRLNALESQSTASVLEIGALLTRAKEMVRKADNLRFADWLRDEVSYSQRTAERAMKARRWYDRQPAEIRHCVDSRFEATALYLISAADPEAVAAFVELAKTNKARISAADVRPIVKPKRKPTEAKPKAEEKADPESKSAFLLRAREAYRLASVEFNGEADKELIKAALDAAGQWKWIATILDQQLEAARKQGQAPKTKLVKFYFHLFEHGTCHLLPKTEDYESPEWQKWRADNPGGWRWRHMELNTDGTRARDANGRPIKCGPWMNPDGTKWKPVQASSPEGQKILKELAAH